MKDQNDDFREKVEKETLEYPESWDPDPGDVLIAIVQGYNQAHTRYGEQYVCNVERETDGEPLSVWLGHTVLLDAFKRKRPEPGERIGIKYHGPHDEKDYEMYTLRVDRSGSDAVPDFESSNQPVERKGGNAPGDVLADQVKQKRRNAGSTEKELPAGDSNEQIPF